MGKFIEICLFRHGIMLGHPFLISISTLEIRLVVKSQILKHPMNMRKSKQKKTPNHPGTPKPLHKLNKKSDRWLPLSGPARSPDAPEVSAPLGHWSPLRRAAAPAGAALRRRPGSLLRRIRQGGRAVVKSAVEQISFFLGGWGVNAWKIVYR